MQFKRGNRAVRDHIQEGKDLLLFRTDRRGEVQFLGQFECAGYFYQPAPDREGAARAAIVFDLVPASSQLQALLPISVVKAGEKQDLMTLRRKALEAARSTPELSGSQARSNLYLRSEAVRRMSWQGQRGSVNAAFAPRHL
jgi:5-methylcytosine-specific restriction enzyme A